MATRRAPERKDPRRAKPQTVFCADCDSEQPEGTIHCEGSKAAYGCLMLLPHHGKALWPECWKCGAGLGCTLCVAGGYQERGSKQWKNPDLVCKRCRVKATLEALLAGGPISKFFMRHGDNKLEWGKVERHTPNLGEYPSPWVRAYAHQQTAAGLSPDEDDEQAMRECRKAFEALRVKPIPKTKGRYALLREKNRQTREAAEQAEQFQATDADLPSGCWDDSEKVKTGLGG